MDRIDQLYFIYVLDALFLYRLFWKPLIHGDGCMCVCVMCVSVCLFACLLCFDLLFIAFGSDTTFSHHIVNNIRLTRSICNCFVCVCVWWWAKAKISRHMTKWCKIHFDKQYPTVLTCYFIDRSFQCLSIAAIRFKFNLDCIAYILWEWYIISSNNGAYQLRWTNKVKECGCLILHRKYSKFRKRINFRIYISL